MSEYDDARERVILELLTVGQNSELFSTSLAQAKGDEAEARAIYFRLRVSQLLER